MKKYQLIVVGGGFSGVAAAVTAAKCGVETLIIEQSNCFGGAATNNLVNPFMPFWFQNQETGEKEYLSCGFFRKIISKLSAANAILSDESIFDQEYLKLLLNDIVCESNVDILFNTTLVGCRKEADNILSVNVHNKSGIQEFEAERFIDATGDGDLAALSNVPFELGRKEDGLCQPMTLCFRIGNIDNTKFHFDFDSWREIESVYNQWKKEGKIDNPREGVLLFNTVCDTIMHFNTTRIVKHNPLDGFDITDAEIKARKQAYDIFRLLKENIRGFENSIMLMTATRIGVRESRRIIGKYQITADDIINCTKFEDSIALGNYDIDIHNPAGTGTTHCYIKPGEYYSIPYRALLPNINANNLLVVGRCISATHEAQAAIRIMPICCCIGEAGGYASAVAVNNQIFNYSAVDTKMLQKLLVDNGARIF